MKSDRPERAEAQGLGTTLKDGKYHLVERQIAIMLPPFIPAWDLGAAGFCCQVAAKAAIAKAAIAHLQ